MNKTLGKYGEKMAENIYVSHGYKIIAKNWCCREGELDLIVEKLNTLVFVEVKCRKSSSKYPVITSFKIARLRKAISKYLLKYPQVEENWRLEALYIYMVERGLYVKRRIITQLP